VTQVQDRTAESSGSGWQDFAAWVTGKQVTLSALALIIAQISLITYVLNRGFFQQDDFAIAGLAAQPFSLHLLFQNYYGHLMPGVFALAWTAVHADGYDWGLWAGSLVALWALAGLALLRALRTLFGNRMALLLPLGVFLFTPIALTDLSWWAIGCQSVPVQLALAMAVDQHVRYIRTGRIRNTVFASLWVVFGLAFDEKAVAIPVLLFALTSAFLVPGSWPRATLSTLRRHWAAWALYGAAMAGEIVVYALSLGTSQNQVKVPMASGAVTFASHLLLDTFVPAVFGGPWHWTVPLGTSSSWALLATASPPPGLLGLSWALAALVITASLVYRRRAWPAWVILVGWLVVVDVVPVVLGRPAVDGSLLATLTYYVSDAMPVLAICLAIAFLPLRDEQHAYRTAPPRGRPRRVVAGTAAVLFAISAVWSATAYRGELHPQNSRSYLATASAALAGVPPGTVVYSTPIPLQMAWILLSQLTGAQDALAPLVNQLPSKQFRWTTAPSGKITSLMIFDAQGRLRPAVIQGPHTYPFRRQADCLRTTAGMRLPLTGTVYPVPVVVQIGYYAARATTVTITFGGHQSRLTLPASKLAYAYLPMQGPGNTVAITPVTSGPQVCIGTITVGNVEASPTAAPEPVFPRPS
jgi:hypothetical protein